MSIDHVAIRAFAKELYETRFKLEEGEDEWYEYDKDIDINIFWWGGQDKPVVNVYRVFDGNTDTMCLIDEFELEEA